MDDQLITPDLIIAEIMDRWPGVINFFLDYRMACIGCSMSSFDTLEDALNVYKLPHGKMIRLLNELARESSGSAG